MRLALLAALLRSGRVPDGHNKGTTRILESWPIGMILAALLLSGCANPVMFKSTCDIQKWELTDRIGDNMVKFNRSLAERPARLRAAEIKSEERANKPFAELVEEAVCETDEQFVHDPNTPEELRRVFEESVKRCRTRKQEQALDRMTERLP